MYHDLLFGNFFCSGVFEGMYSLFVEREGEAQREAACCALSSYCIIKLCDFIRK